MLALGMALSGILIIRTRGRSGSFPAWLGYFSLVVAVCELGQFSIFFVKTGPFSGDGAGAWYLATFTWARGFWPPAGQRITCWDGSKRSVSQTRPGRGLVVANQQTTRAGSGSRTDRRRGAQSVRRQAHSDARRGRPHPAGVHPPYDR